MKPFGLRLSTWTLEVAWLDSQGRYLRLNSGKTLEMISEDEL